MDFHRSGKTLTQHCSSLFPLFLVRVANRLAFLVRRAALPEWRKTIWRPNTSFQFSKFSFINIRWKFISAKKQFSWKMILQKSEEQVSFSILSCNIGQFTHLLNFWLRFLLILLWKWNDNYSEAIQCRELLRKTANFLCRVIKGWLSTALGLVSRLFCSCSLPPQILNARRQLVIFNAPLN